MTERLIQLNAKVLEQTYFPVKLNVTSSLSAPYRVCLDLMTQDAIDQAALIDQPASVIAQHKQDDQPNIWQGIITSVQQLSSQVNGWKTYQLIIEPKWTALRYASDCRIFQQQTVPEIISGLFKAYHIEFDQSRLTQDYQPREYCTQYNETTFDFISRLLQEAGIYVTYQQSQEGEVIVLNDIGFGESMGLSELLLSNDADFDQPHIHRFEQSAQKTIGKVVRRRFDKATPDKTVETISSNRRTQRSAPTEFTYPHKVRTETIDQQEALTQRELLAAQVPSLQAHATSDYLSILPNQIVTLYQQENNASIGQWRLIDVDYHVEDYSGVPTEGDAQEKQHLVKTTFIAIPADRVFVPEITLFQPRIYSVQNAQVVGPKKQTVFTDELGRIKVQFPWDRYGQFDQNSSCFIRVVQQFAGNGYGAQFIPRIGSEVLVAFENGHVDQPMIIGSAFNSDNLPPFEPATNPTQLGFKTQTLGQESASSGHTLRFDDSPQNAGVLLHSQGDHQVLVKGKGIKQLGGASTTVIEAGDFASHTGGALKIQAQNEVKFSAGGSSITINAGGVSFDGPVIMIDPGAVPTPSLPAEPSLLAKHVMQSLGISANPTPVASKLKTFRKLITLKLNPKWRKTTPEANLESFATLLRLPHELRQQIQNTINQYCHQVKEKPQDQVLPDNWVSAYQTAIANDKEAIPVAEMQQRVKKALDLNDPQNLRAGWIYVFAQCDGDTDYHGQYRLFHEYKVNYDEASNLYAPVDLSQWAGADIRQAGAYQADTIEVPYLSEMGAKFTVKVMFSGVQLSWPRINRLGGIAPQDPRLADISNAQQKTLLQAVQSYSFDAQLSGQRAGAPLPEAMLDETYRVQYQHATPQFLTTDQTNPEADWQKQSVYFLDSRLRGNDMGEGNSEGRTQRPAPTQPSIPILLLSDPLGMVLESQQAIYNAWSTFTSIINQISNAQGQMPLAVLTNQVFFRLGSLHNIQQQQALQAAAQYIDPAKLSTALQRNPRRWIKSMIARWQQILIAFMQSKVPAGAQWAVDINTAITDYFAQGERLQTAYGQFLGMIEPACIDPSQVDQLLDEDPAAQYVIQNNQVLRQRTNGPHIDSVNLSGLSRHLSTQQKPTVGLVYIQQIITGQSPLSGIVLPKSSQINQSAQAAELSTLQPYLNGEGQYDSSVLQNAFTVHDNLSLHGAALETFVNNQLKLFNAYLSGWLTHFKQLRDEALTDSQSMILKMVVDANGIDPSSLVFAKDLGKDYQPISRKIIKHLVKQESDRITQISASYASETTCFMVLDRYTGEPKLYTQFEHAEKHLSIQTASGKIAEIHQSHNTQRILGDDPTADQTYQSTLMHGADDRRTFLAKSDTVDPELGLHSTRWGIRINTGIITLMALCDLEASIQAAVNDPNLEHIALLSANLIDVVQGIHEVAESVLGEARLTNALGGEGSVVNQLFEPTCLLGTTSIFDCLGIVGSSITTFYTWRSFVNLIGKDNPGALIATGAQAASSSLMLLAGVKGIANSINAAKAASSSDAGDAELEAGADGENLATRSVADPSYQLASDTVYEKVGSKLGVSDIVEVIGDFLPGADVIFFMAQAAQIVSLIADLYRDTPYERWAKRSPFSNTKVSDAYTTNTQAYAGLLNLTLSPSLQVSKVDANGTATVSSWAITSAVHSGVTVDSDAALISNQQTTAADATAAQGITRPIILLPANKPVGHILEISNLAEQAHAINAKANRDHTFDDGNPLKAPLFSDPLEVWAAQRNTDENYTANYLAGRAQLKVSYQGQEITVPNALDRSDAQPNNMFCDSDHWRYQLQLLPYFDQTSGKQPS